MDKKKLSFKEMEQLFEQLAECDEQAAREAAQLDLVQRVAREEINRFFLRRHCIRATALVSVLVLAGGGFALLLPDADVGHAVAEAPAPQAIPEIQVHQVSVVVTKGELPESFCADAHMNYNEHAQVRAGAGCLGGFDTQALPVMF